MTSVSRLPKTASGAESSDGSESPLYFVVSVCRRYTRFIVGVCLAVIAAGLIYWLVTPPTYRVDVLVQLRPPETARDMPALPGALGQLADLAGVEMDKGSDSREFVIAKANSRAFIGKFIDEQRMMPVLFASEWDASRNHWTEPADAPTREDAVLYVRERVLVLVPDLETEDLLTIRFLWRDRNLAAQWAQAFVTGINEDLRAAELNEANANIAFLTQRLETERQEGLRTALIGLLSAESKRAMLATGRTEFLLRTIDPAAVPDRPIWPRLWIVGVLGALLGLLVALGAVFTWVLVGSRALEIASRAWRGGASSG